MAQAWASPAVLTAGSQAAPKIPTSCRRSSDRSQTVVQLPACLAPQFEPHVVPSRRVPRLSSLALTRIEQRLLGCRILLRRNRAIRLLPVRDFCSGAYTPPSHSVWQLRRSFSRPAVV